MDRKEAEKMLIERFEQLNEAAQKEGIDNTELCALADSAHKLYITLVNAGAFDGNYDFSESDGLKS